MYSFECIFADAGCLELAIAYQREQYKKTVICQMSISKTVISLTKTVIFQMLTNPIHFVH